jgi:hypothetical protein
MEKIFQLLLQRPSKNQPWCPHHTNGDKICKDGKQSNICQSQGVKNYVEGWWHLGGDNNVVNDSVGALGITSLYLCLSLV